METVSLLHNLTVTHTQAVATAVETEEFDFSLADDEGVELVEFAAAVPAIFPAGTADAMYRIGLNINPNPAFSAETSAQADDTNETDDVIWEFRTVIDLVTSGVAVPVNYEQVYRIPPGLVVAQNVFAFFNSNNTGGPMVARLKYRIVRLTDRELVSLVARRRG